MRREAKSGDAGGRVVGPGFHQRVFDVVRRVPRGRVTTYGRVAELLGHPGVARHVGFALAACGDVTPVVPWHRVVDAQGRISTAGAEQRRRLEAEGVRFSRGGAVVLASCVWPSAD